jgi:predicted glycosyltransferase
MFYDADFYGDFMRRHENARVLMYSHDTFGLGHLRRCREIAHALVERFKGLQVLIISGSSIAGAFDFRARVDFIKIPSVIKLYNGEYTSLAQHIDLAETLEMRRAIIRQTADLYRPNIFIVDKEPLGLRGELEQTLTMLRERGTTLVLGLREVLDAPEQVKLEWQRSDALRRIEELYDAIWVYGSRNFWDPLNGLDVPASVRSRMTFTGHLNRNVPRLSNPRSLDLPDDFILVTAGGGGDGGPLMRQVLAAREYDRTLDFPLVMILGPFMVAEEREEIRERGRQLPNVTVLDFESQIETIMTRASAIVSMGGYNTFCEILSFDKRALLVPRSKPRREQQIRATRAAELGLVDTLDSHAASDPRLMARALRRLPTRPLPSERGAGVDLGGLEAIAEMVGIYIEVAHPLPVAAPA